jgi:replication factor A1
VGLLGDETGTIKFVAFETSDLPELEEGKSYRLENVVSDEYQGNYSVKLNRTTEIIELDDDIEPDDNTDSVTGAIVEVDDGYGLIRRCPNNDCGKKLNDGRCRDHGEVDGDDDLALKLAVDTGLEVFTAYFDREETVELTDINLDEALDIAHEEIDRSAVIDEMEPKLLGQYITVTGPTWEDDYGGDNIKANEYESNPNIGVDDTEQMLVKARSI